MGNDREHKHLKKSQLKMFVGMASDKEQEHLRYAVLKSSGISVTQAPCQYVFEKMYDCASNDEDSIKYNWFEFCQQLECVRKSCQELQAFLDKIYKGFTDLGLTDVECSPVFQSKQVPIYFHVKKSAVNKEVVTISESENTKEYAGLKDLLNTQR